MAKKPYTFTTIGTVYEEATGKCLGQTKMRRHTIYPDGRHTVEIIAESTLEDEAETMRRIGQKMGENISKLCDTYPELFDKLAP